MRIFLLIAVILCGQACSFDRTKYADPDDGPDNVVYQFIDAETMKPIQGAYVNPIWMKPTPSGKVGSPGCVRAALLRSDANGWVRMKGPKGGILGNINFMVPGYDHFKYQYETPDKQHVLNIIRVDRDDVKQYPAWAKNLENLGYYYDSRRWSYVKIFPVDGFKDNLSDRKMPQIYFVRNRAFPGDTMLSIFGQVNQCGNGGGEDIGMDDKTANETNTRRGIIQANQLCDEKWDTAAGYQPYGALATALWLVADPMDLVSASSELAEHVPSYPKVVTAAFAGRVFTKTERLQFCAWIKPYVEKYQ